MTHSDEDIPDMQGHLEHCGLLIADIVWRCGCCIVNSPSPHSHFLDLTKAVLLIVRAFHRSPGQFRNVNLISAPHQSTSIQLPFDANVGRCSNVFYILITLLTECWTSVSKAMARSGLLKMPWRKKKHREDRKNHSRWFWKTWHENGQDSTEKQSF